MKKPTVDFTDEMRLWRLMILMEMVLEVVIGVLVMEVDKVSDEVTDMEVDKVAGQENVEFFHIPSFFNL